MSDPWLQLRAATPARVGLGRTGDTLPINDVLSFQLAHARARDAVHTPLDTDALIQSVAPLTTLTLHSQAIDRATYLRRPDLGRRLDPSLGIFPTGPFNVVFVIADGLSPVGVQRHAPPLLQACLTRLVGWTIAPIIVATQRLKIFRRRVERGL
jgi:ethanolamine ammonia-lyase small subunit